MKGSTLNAPGVIGIPTRIYVSVSDVMVLMGCKKSKASEQIREANHRAEESGKLPFSQGKANKYIFAEMFGVPIDEVNRVLDFNDRKELVN